MDCVVVVFSTFVPVLVFILILIDGLLLLFLCTSFLPLFILFGIFYTLCSLPYYLFYLFFIFARLFVLFLMFFIFTGAGSRYRYPCLVLQTPPGVVVLGGVLWRVRTTFILWSSRTIPNII